jgi:hypothetical protein
MDLLEKASIILTPTAYNNGEALCVKPSDASGDFQFSRATEGTRVNSQGLIETIGINLPRINYEGGCGSWLFEPQSTNLFDYSKDFSDIFWTKSGVTITSNSIVSPNGTQDASTLVSSNATSQQMLKGRFNVINGNDYTISTFAKKKDFDFIHLRFEGGGGSFPSLSAFFNINNGTLGTIDSGISATIKDFGNGWYRVSATNTATATAQATTRIQLASSDNQDNVVGNGTDGTYIWGAQAEEQSYSTSLIPTDGSQTTRNQDVCTNGGSLASINSTEGVLYFEGSTLVNGGSNKYISLSNNTSSNRLQVIFHNNSNRLSITMVGAIGSVGAINDLSFVQTNNNKVAVSYSALGLRLFVNGVLVGSNTDNASFTPNTLTTLDFALWNQTTAPFEGNTKCLAVWKEALSDSELQSLTTI